ncbi:Sensor histidine kinase TmoS [Enhygromyxa salina]|uniref:histidine kinase n=1 Tax=Enhygromyxa salina TaxID=215803 RepID=A0A2S9XJZ7_9BACT|nr:AAA family ATPase [Enhygromyxa salina]PRP93209.1 Sensor histidine kinase TmoS [Enhygromyxa salina]
MNLLLDGYRTERLLRSSPATRVYEAVRDQDQLEVVIKVYELGPDEGVEARVEHEFRLLHELHVDGVARALALERQGTQLTLVLERRRGVSISDYADDRALPIDLVLDVAQQLARILTDVHAQRVIHRDIKPANILIDPETHLVALVDFGISALLEREGINDPEVVDGTLPYISPEQTGRTQREVDLRSDLYSLGVTLYELLTGRRPFESRSPLELIHAHLARRPESPQRLRAEIPTPLAAIVMKLLEKAPERRYQSARGLGHDLRCLAAALRDGHRLDEFELGLADVPMTLQLPHRLYGRSEEIEMLVGEYRRAGEGEPRFALITGPAGIGKSALFGQLAEPVIGRQGFLARGKFEREQSDKPYAGFVIAFNDLVAQLLTETDDQLARWRRELIDALGPLAGAMCELVPTLRAIIGAPPAMPEVGLAEAHNRAALACVRMMGLFARVEHPLVLALDDIHRADRASCELLATLLAEPSAALLIVGTMRMDEVVGGEPIREVIDEAVGEREEMLWLDLAPLARADVAALVGDSLARSPDEVASLAELVGRKTNHNPLFIRQFLAHLVERSLLRPTAGGWTWDLQAIELAGIPEDLVEMMTEKLAGLDEGPRELLTVAAVIGPRFDVATLELVAGSRDLGRGLVRLVNEGLLTAVGSSRYTFAHDRVREVAYLMVPLERRCLLHRQIGHFRFGRVGLSDLSNAVFELVDHIDLGYGLIPLADEDPAAASARADLLLDEMDEFERSNLAELNALAGYKALNGAAAVAAAGYLEAGITLLERDGGFPGPGEIGYTLRLGLELGLCQALALSGQREQAEGRFAALLRRPVGPADYGRIVSKRVESHILASDRRAAVEAGLAGLRELGYEIEPQRGVAEAGAAVLRLVPRLRLRELRELSTRPRADEPTAKAAMEILMTLGSATQFVDVALHVALVATHVHLLLVHGRHSSGPLALTQLAASLAFGLGRRELALEVLEIARELAEREGPECMRHRMDATLWLVAGWRRPYSDALTPLRESSARAVEAGDIEFAGYTTALQVPLGLATGLHMRAQERAIELGLHRLQQWGARSLLPEVEAHAAFVRLMLAGDERALAQADPLGIGAHERDPELRRAWLSMLVLQAQLLYLFGRYRDAWDALCAHERELEQKLRGAWKVGAYYEVRGLLAAALYARASLLERPRLLWTLERNYRRLRRHARQGTVGFEASATLLEAELAAIRGPIDRAFELFGRARREAAAQRALMTEAVALERMAEHARARGLDDLALGPLREARSRYQHWGAQTKVVALERRWPFLSGDAASAWAPEGERAGPEPRNSRSTVHAGSARSGGPGSTSGRALDMATILKASQAISADIHLDEVVGRVMALALENAGADRGVLLLTHGGQTAMVAICSADQPLQSFLRDPVALAEAGDQAPVSLLHFVERTREAALFDDISADLRFAGDAYVAREGVRSAMCVPILKQTRYVGLLYLENKLSPGSFTADRLEVLDLLVTQAASALENAQLYEQLRTSEVRWRSLVEGLPDVIMLVDLDGRIEFMNHLGHERDLSRRLGMLAGEFIDPAYLPALRVAMSEVIDEAELRELEIVGNFVGAEPRWYSARLAPIVVDGRVERIIAVGTDITRRREAEATQAELEATLRQQQRLESIGTLASGVAHEINNPVQGIMNYAELISTSPDASELTREFADEIGVESQRVATIVRNLLAFSRQEGDRVATPAKLDAIVEGTLSLIRAVLRKDHIDLHVDIPAELPTVDCHVQQIQQVIMNLVTNARDAVCGRWGDYHDDKRIEIVGRSFERGGRSWVRLSVRDQGGGVPEDIVGRIFDPFFTTKGRDQGTGLGLAVSHGIISEHGGELWLENHPGESASFHVELSACADTP